MHEPSAISNSEPALTQPVSRAGANPRSLELRALFRGVAVGAGGALTMSTLIGVTAVLGMAHHRLSPETMIRQLHAQWDLRVFIAASYLLMAVLAGYAAGLSAGRGEIRHAICAGVGTLAMNLLVIALCGSPLPLWLAAGSLASVVPCAMLGGYLALPVIRATE